MAKKMKPCTSSDARSYLRCRRGCRRRRRRHLSGRESLGLRGQDIVRRQYNTDRKWYRGMETGLGFEFQGWGEVWGITRLGIKDAVSADSRNIVPSKPCEMRGMERGARKPCLMALLYDA